MNNNVASEFLRPERECSARRVPLGIGSSAGVAVELAPGRSLINADTSDHDFRPRIALRLDGSAAIPRNIASWPTWVSASASGP